VVQRILTVVSVCATTHCVDLQDASLGSDRAPSRPMEADGQASDDPTALPADEVEDVVDAGDQSAADNEPPTAQPTAPTDEASEQALDASLPDTSSSDAGSVAVVDARRPDAAPTMSTSQPPNFPPFLPPRCYFPPYCVVLVDDQGNVTVILP
jgi:hypothetical protein